MYAYSITKETYSRQVGQKFYHLNESDIINIVSNYKKAQECLNEFGILNNKEYEFRMFPVECYIKRYKGDLTETDYKEIWEIKQWEI